MALVMTASVTLDTSVAEISAPYISLKVETISLVLIPLAYRVNI
jgi:hypothetical protein